MDADEKWMKETLRLAKKGIGAVSPNPLVGAVIVRKGKLVGSGYHQKAGSPHAEINAVLQAGKEAKGATLYVNLEPCCHTEKRTPPCTSAILKSGLKKVVIGMRDPNPEVNGKGVSILQNHGILVKEDVCHEEASVLNEIFAKFITTGLPFVGLKIAATLDGKIATSKGQSHWITGKKSRERVHRLRNQYDAVMVGKGTILADNPALTTRLTSGPHRNPIRIVVDENLSIPLDVKVFDVKNDEKVVVATTRYSKESKIRELEKKNVEVIQIKEENGLVHLPSLFTLLGEMKITSVLIEGGAKLNASVINDKIVDKVYYFVAPKLMGGQNAVSAIGGSSPATLSAISVLKKVKIRREGEDILIEGYLK